MSSSVIFINQNQSSSKVHERFYWTMLCVSIANNSWGELLHQKFSVLGGFLALGKDWRYVELIIETLEIENTSYNRESSKYENNHEIKPMQEQELKGVHGKTAKIRFTPSPSNKTFTCLHPISTTPLYNSKILTPLQKCGCFE